MDAPDFFLAPIHSAAEIAQALEVYRQCEDFLALGPVPHASLEMVLADLALSREMGGLFCGIFARPGGEMLGVVDYVPGEYHGEAGLGYISLLMIARPHRASGLGSAVVAAVEADMHAYAMRQHAPLCAVECGTQVNNPGGLRFWQRHGFRIISGPELMTDGTTVYALRKELAPENTKS